MLAKDVQSTEVLSIADRTVQSLVVFQLDQAATNAVNDLQQQPIRVVLAADLLNLAKEPGDWVRMKAAIATLEAESFEAAIIFSATDQSPYQAAYLCYLAGIPLRIAQSQEFGGGLLTHCFSPPATTDPHQALLEAIGLHPALSQSTKILSAPT